MTELRLKAVLGPRNAAPNPEHHLPGAGSTVTIFEIFEHSVTTYIGGSSLVSDAVARFYDEWGQVGQLPVRDLVVTERPTPPHET